MFDEFMYQLDRIWAIGILRFVVFVALAFIAAKVVSDLVTKLLKKAKLDEKLDKWGINEGAAGTSLKFIGKLVYLIVFLCFIPSALEAIGISSVAHSISNFVSSFIGYVPNIIAAVILVYVGVMVARILGQIVSVLLKKTKIDALLKQENPSVVLSDVLSKILVTVVILVSVVAALGVLNISAISSPAISIVHSIFNAIPSIILAVVVVAVGILVANLACDLLHNVLVAVHFDKVVKKVLPQLKASATKIVVNVVRAIIIIFVAAQGIQALNLSILTMIVADVIAYLPLVVKAGAILLAAFIGANLLENILVKTCPKCAKLVKAAVFTVAAFMILSQLGIATKIVETAFVVTVSALAVAFALAFGLGGKDYARKVLDKLDEKKTDEK